VAPEILFPPKDTVIVKGARLTELQCIANARPLLEMELVWLKDGKPLEEAGIGFSFNDLWNRTLSLLQADSTYEGTYSCEVRMRTGGPTMTKEAKVTVIGKAVLMYPPTNHQQRLIITLVKH
jgi:protein sidekick